MKQKLNKCPERNNYASEEERLIDDSQSVYRERLLYLNPTLRWIIPAQENCAVKINITGVGERISRRFWAAGIDADGFVQCVRSIGVATLRDMALGIVQEGVAAPFVPAITDKNGEVCIASDTPYIHAMEDTSWIERENNLYVVKKPIAIKQDYIDVYRAKYVNGKMQAVDGHVELEMTLMNFYTRLADPTEEEIQSAHYEIEWSVREHYYGGIANISILCEYGIRLSKDYKELMLCPKDFCGAYKVPDSVTSIKWDAFHGCVNLKSISISKNYKGIISPRNFVGCAT